MLWALFVILDKSMNSVRRLNRKKINFSNQVFQILWLIRGIKVIKNTKFHYTVPLGLAGTIVGLPYAEVGSQY